MCILLNGGMVMLERLEQELRNWLQRLQTLFEEMRSRKAVASFFEKKAEKIVNEYWELLQLVYEEDVLAEMRKQGYDPEQETEIPKPVWKTISKKLKPILKYLSEDASDLLKVYGEEVAEFNSILKEDLFLIQTATTDDALTMFNITLKEK